MDCRRICSKNRFAKASWQKRFFCTRAMLQEAYPGEPSTEWPDFLLGN